MELDRNATARQRALFCLEGLSLGDALGERFFGPPARTLQRIEERWLPPPPWRYTDDTVMALSVVQTLLVHGRLLPDPLARHLARRYAEDTGRGYGAGAHDLMQALGAGTPWELAAPAMFGGSGSFGNGAAMRVAPLGAFLAQESPEVLVEQASLSAVVTHAHPEGVAGAVAVALAAAAAWRQAARGSLDADRLLRVVLQHTPASETHAGIQRAAELPPATTVEQAAQQLGSGGRVSAQDTVPFVMWCIARCLQRGYEEAIWTTVRGLGDRDTTCAMVGGVMALAAGIIPDGWLSQREPLPPLGATAAAGD